MGSALRIGSPLTSPTSKMIQQMASVTTFRLCLVLGLVTIQQAQAEFQCTADCLTKFNPEEDPEKCAGLTVAPQEGTCDHCINQCALSELDGKVPPAKLCHIDCVLKFNSEDDPEKCTGKNFLEKGTCDDCIKECAITEFSDGEADPSTSCDYDCVVKFINASNGGARRSLSVTIVVISFFVALVW